MLSLLHPPKLGIVRAPPRGFGCSYRSHTLLGHGVHAPRKYLLELCSAGQGKRVCFGSTKTSPLLFIQALPCPADAESLLRPICIQSANYSKVCVCRERWLAWDDTRSRCNHRARPRCDLGGFISTTSLPAQRTQGVLRGWIFVRKSLPPAAASKHYARITCYG